MCTIFMYMDALYIFTVDIASAMIALVNYQAMFTYSFCLVGKNGAEQTGTYYQIIIFSIIT